MARLLVAVPNGGSRNIMEAVNLKRQGVMPGCSDLILLKPSGGFGALCIEMKYGKGRQTDEQIEFQKSVEKAGNKYAICRTFDEFVTEIENYLN